MKLSDYLSIKYNISKRVAKTYLKKGAVKLNGKTTTENIEITPHDFIELTVSFPKIEYSLNDFLIKKYDNIIFLYKPPFMHTERHKIEDSLTVSDIIKNSFPNFNLISRLDYETDGVIAAVRNGYEIDFMRKKYMAIGVGKLENTVILNNVIDYQKKKKVKITTNRNDAYKSVIKPIKYHKRYTLLKITLQKAQRHQIRAYLAHLNIPILGDTLYGNYPFKRMMLSCIYTHINDKNAVSPQMEKFIDIFNNL